MNTLQQRTIEMKLIQYSLTLVSIYMPESQWKYFKYLDYVEVDHEFKLTPEFKETYTNEFCSSLEYFITKHLDLIKSGQAIELV